MQHFFRLETVLIGVREQKKLSPSLFAQLISTQPTRSDVFAPLPYTGP